MGDQLLMQRWAPIIYARTLEVDFRFIVVPAFFTQDWTDHWVLEHVTSTMRNAEKLVNGPRWSLFQNDICRVLGVTCQVHELVGEQDPMTRDEHGRTLYAFVGIASLRKQTESFLAVPLYSTKLTPSRAPIAGLYELVRPHWSDTHQLPPERLPPSLELHVTNWWRRRTYGGWMRPRVRARIKRSLRVGSRRVMNMQPRWSPVLNEDPGQLALWQDSQNMRAILWQVASVHNKPISLCLGLATRRDAQRSPFMNATVFSLTERSERIDRVT